MNIKIVWSLGIISTGVLFSFPTRLTYLYSQIQSISILGPPSFVFFIVFYLWMASLALTVYKSKNPKLAGLLASNLLVLVIVGFWTLRTNFPIPKEDGTLAYAFFTSVLVQGHITSTSSDQFFLYTVWPLTTALTTMTSRLLGFSLSQSMVFVTFWCDQLASSLLFFVFGRILSSYRLGFIALTLFWIGGIYNQSSAFTPTVYGYPLLAGLLLLTIRISQGHGTAKSYMPSFLVLSVALALGHFITALVFLGMTSAVAIASASERRSLIQVAIIGAIFVITPVLYSNIALNFLGSSIHGIFQNPFGQFQQAYISKVGPQLPQWVSYITLGWQIVVIVPVLVLVPGILVWRKRIQPMSRFVGLLAAGTIMASFFLVLGGIGYALSALVYLPIIAAPAVVLFAKILSPHKGIGVCILAIALIAFSLPTFLAYNRNQVIYAVNGYDMGLYSYSEIHLPPNINFFSSWDNYLPYINNYTMDFFDTGSVHTAAGLWVQWNQSISAFSHAPIQDRVFLFSLRNVVPWQSQVNIAPDDPHWQAVLTKLALHNRVYDSDYGVLYE